MSKPNALLDSIKRSKAYLSFKKETRLALLAQWDDLINSGIIGDLHDSFAPVFEKHRNEIVAKSTSSTRRAVNRAILSGQAASLDKLQRYVTDEVTGQQKKLGGYSGYGQSVKTHLYNVMQKGGQSEINRYAGSDAYKFRLSKQYYINLINDRASKLIKSVDKTTAEKFARQITRGLAKGDSKQDLVKRLTKIAPDMAKWRAERIVKTETSAAVQFMRHETARLNGVEFKAWSTSGSNPCHKCLPMDGIAMRVQDNFPEVDVPYPPLHPNCECSVDYLLNPAEVKGFNLGYLDQDALDMIEEYDVIYKSSIKPLWVSELGTPRKKFNALAVWVGGEGLSGKDKHVATYLKLIQTEGFVEFKEVWANTSWDELDEWANKLDGLAIIYGKKLYKDVAKFKAALSVMFTGYLPHHVMLGRNQYIWMVLIQARAHLSDAGFEQLVMQLGVKGYIRPRT